MKDNISQNIRSSSTATVDSPSPIGFVAVASHAKVGDLATRTSRLFAALIDGGLAVALMLPLAASAESSYGDYYIDPYAGSSAMSMPLVLALFALAAIQMTLIATKGQSIGKAFMGIRIVKVDDESAPGFFKGVFMRGAVGAVIGQIPFVGFIYGLVDCLAIFSENRRCLHDMIAGTKVIKA